MIHQPSILLPCSRLGCNIRYLSGSCHQFRDLRRTHLAWLMFFAPVKTDSSGVDNRALA